MYVYIYIYYIITYIYIYTCTYTHVCLLDDIPPGRTFAQSFIGIYLRFGLFRVVVKLVDFRDYLMFFGAYLRCVYSFSSCNMAPVTKWSMMSTFACPTVDTLW